MNRNPYPVEVIILAPGQVTGWTLGDALGNEQPVEAPLRAGERFTLQPGDSLGLTYVEPPAWRWKATQ